jgi:hypothetical protein
MSGFLNARNNVLIQQSVFDKIISQVRSSCGEMKSACQKSSGRHLHNHEDKITNRLYEHHLKDSRFCGLKFTIQKPETFDEETDLYIGRTDIHVESWDKFKNVDDYYLIECKRIDGTPSLNRLYVSEGVARFVVHPPKYPSYHKRNIMLGYIVKAIVVGDNSKEIADIQSQTLTGVESSQFTLVTSDEEFYRYSCTYQSEHIGQIELAHLFFDFASVMGAA